MGHATAQFRALAGTTTEVSGEGTLRVSESALRAFDEVCAQAAREVYGTEVGHRAGGGGVAVMGARRWVSEELTTARVNDCAVSVEQAHRYRAGVGSVPGPGGCVVREAVLVTVSVPVGLSVEDVAAVLFDWGQSEEDLADEEQVRYLVAAAVATDGCLGLDELRLASARSLDAEQGAYLAFCRDRAIAVFGASGVEGSVGSGRALVAVS